MFSIGDDAVILLKNFYFSKITVLSNLQFLLYMEHKNNTINTRCIMKVNTAWLGGRRGVVDSMLKFTVTRPVVSVIIMVWHIMFQQK